ncbi:coiled-coil domain-containing protein [Roseovarius salinarum]|uniref:hypothetical protein n=1 Tax=Roseovarius salinarum TaxID=1981892 RepID=UPI000C320C27|nr:hypothetical protein [Roseovarius salinarum]
MTSWVFRLLALSILACGSPALAQTVTVRSGEHERFSRLVFDLPSRMDWQLSPTGDGRELSLARQDLVFDTSEVFSRIPRTRLSGLSVDAETGTIQLSLACDCTVNGFWYGESFLVIDIESPEEGEAERAERPARPSRDAFESPSPVDQGSERADGKGNDPTGAQSTSSGGPTELALERLVPPGEPDATGNAPATAGRLSVARDRLLRNLARAASQGLLTPLDRTQAKEKPAVDDQVPERSPQGRAPDASAKEMKPSVPEPPDRRTPAGLANLKAQSTVDRDFRARYPETEQTRDGEFCLDAEELAIGEWADDGGFGNQLGRLRAQLTGELGETSPDTALALARFYLHFGFGAEAGQALRFVELPARTHSVLTALARIMEDGHAGAENILADQLSCDSPAAFWSVLSHERLPRGRAIDTDAVLRTLSGLPQHLRPYLGGMLADRFMNADRKASARDVLRILDRAPAEAHARARLVHAEIALADNEHEVAESQLDDVARAGKPASARAVLRRIESRLARDAAISYETAQLAAALATEHRGTPLGRDLERAQILAAAASGAFEEAYAHLDRIETRRGALASDGVPSELLALMAETADDVTFLRFAAARHPEGGEMPAPQAANAAARRLLELGFTKPAARYLETEAEGAARREQRLLRAERFLQLRLPRQAEAALLGLSGDAANKLRARARSMAGEHGAAHAYYQALGEPRKAEREAWLGGDWSALRDSENEVLARIARLATGDPGADDVSAGATQNGALARKRHLIEDAGATRASMEALLRTRISPEASTE